MNRLRVGPLRIGGADVVIRTNEAMFAELAGRVFADLRRAPLASPAAATVVFDTVRHHGPTPHWSVERDGVACELDLREDAVMVHQQWELNRLAIEQQPAAIHGAAVVVDESAVLVVGRSHSGKTTLAGWLAAHHGCPYVSDEVAVVDRAGRIVPFPRPLGIRADSPLAPATREDGSTKRFMPHERLIPAADLGAVVAKSPVSVDAIVFPCFRSDADAILRPLSQADTLERLALLTPGLARHGREVFEQLVHLVRDTHAFEVTYGQVTAAAPLVLSAVRGGRPT